MADVLTRRALEAALREVAFEGGVYGPNEVVLLAARKLLDMRPASEEEVADWVRLSVGYDERWAPRTEAWRAAERRLNLLADEETTDGR